MKKAIGVSLAIIVMLIACTNPLGDPFGKFQGIKGGVSIEGLDDASNVLIVAEGLTNGQT